MAWFGWKSGRADARPVLGRRIGWIGGAGGDWPQSYEGQVREAVMRNPVAQRSMRLVSEGAAGVPLYGDDADGARVAGLAAGVVEVAAAHLLLHGNAYLRPVADGAGRVVELVALRPERVTVETDAGGWPVAYRYAAGDSVARLVADEGARPGVIHIRAVHPLDDHYGLGCLGAAAGAVAIHNASAAWNKALLDNAARPSGALVYEPGEPGATLSPDQFERLKAEMEASFSGAANAGRPMLLEGGLRWQAMSLTPADMDFAGMKAQAAREIALAFGVPPMLLGLPGDNTYANYGEANRALYRLTVVPIARKIADAVGAGLGAALRLDLDQVPALAADRERLWAQAAGADFLTRAEKREMLGFGVEASAG
ncbi:phage portal protein [Sphingomonas naphthae]|uniref:Phage portal protein n=1 Tax=Sphingomonas naphthae TaxID=1813468 RepID=A0ABY7TKH5_9SPHN|nr:phage portal protein [Sphingomonas naphthae]WCT73669.1 phage portal protein [Sphingomonas naphthae]